MNSIEWRQQNVHFGLNYSTKTGKWEDWKFDIRYDYDGDPFKEPSGCILNLTIYKNNNPVHKAQSYKIENLVFECELYMRDEQRKFLKANFG